MIKLTIAGLSLVTDTQDAVNAVRLLQERVGDMARGRRAAESMRSRITERQTELDALHADLRAIDGHATAAELMGATTPAIDEKAAAAKRKRVAALVEDLERMRAAEEAAPVVFEPLQDALHVAVAGARAPLTNFRETLAADLAQAAGVARGLAEALEAALRCVSARTPDLFDTKLVRQVVDPSILTLLGEIASAEAAAASESAPLTPPPPREPEPGQPATQIVGEAPDPAGREDRARDASVRDYARQVPQHQRASDVNYANYETVAGGDR
jgi:hypothetical protein